MGKWDTEFKWEWPKWAEGGAGGLAALPADDTGWPLDLSGGVDKQVAYWISSTDLSGENEFWYDYETNQLALRTNTPIGTFTIQDLVIDTTAAYYGIYNEHEKTAGVTDHDDPFYGIYNHSTVNDSSEEHGSLYGLFNWSELDDGDLGDVSNQRSQYATFNQVTHTAGTVSGNSVGSYVIMDLGGGTVSGDSAGMQVLIDQEAGHTITGSAHGLYISGDYEGTVTGTNYMIYLNEILGVDFGVYQDGSAVNFFGGWTSVGEDDSPTGMLTVQDTAIDSTEDYYGLYNIHIKTSGVTNYNDDFYGIWNIATINDGGEENGTLAGFLNKASLTTGDLGSVANPKNQFGIYNQLEQASDQVYGSSSSVYTLADLHGGIVSGNSTGIRIIVDQEAAHQIVANAYGLQIWADWDGTVGGTSCMIRLDENTGVDYGIYQNGTATNYFGGWVSIGEDATPTLSPLTNIDTTYSTTGHYYGIYNIHTKTAGATDHADKQAGIYNDFTIDHTGQDHGYVTASWNRCYLKDGDVGAVGNEKDARAIYCQIEQDAGTVTQDGYALYGLMDLDAGTIAGDAIGLYSYIDQAAGHTISGDAYGLRVRMDMDGTVGNGGANDSYMIYMEENSNVTYGIYQDGTATNYLQGSLGIGDNTPGHLLEVQGTNSTSAGGPAIQVNNISTGATDATYDARLLVVTGAGAADAGGDAGDPYITLGIGSGTTPREFAQLMVDNADSQKLKCNMRVNAGTTYEAFHLTNAGRPRMMIGGGATPGAILHVHQGGTAREIPVLALTQLDTDEEFIDYIGTSAADQTKSISTVNGDGSVEGPKNYSSSAGWAFEGMVRIAINNVERWMPYYSADTS